MSRMISLRKLGHRADKPVGAAEIGALPGSGIDQESHLVEWLGV